MCLEDRGNVILTFFGNMRLYKYLSFFDTKFDHFNLKINISELKSEMKFSEIFAENKFFSEKSDLRSKTGFSPFDRKN